MSKRNNYRVTFIWIIILIGLAAAFWNHGAYFLPIVLITIAIENLCNAIWKGRLKKVGRSIELAVLLIGFAVALVTQPLPGIILTLIAYTLVREGLRRLQRKPRSSSSQSLKASVTPAPQRPSQPKYPTSSAPYQQGYQAKQADKTESKQEPYVPYQPAPPSTKTTTQFELPQVDYPEVLPPQ
jgi:energy-coupling factor transporter transmembrane protein EcfT